MFPLYYEGIVSKEIMLKNENKYIWIKLRKNPGTERNSTHHLKQIV